MLVGNRLCILLCVVSVFNMDKLHYVPLYLLVVCSFSTSIGELIFR